MQLVPVPTHMAEQAWALVGHLIVQAMKRGGVGDAGPVYADVVAGRSLLWLALDESGVHAAAVTEIAEHQGDKLLTIVACGGHQRERWVHFIEGLHEYGRQQDCKRARIIGRAGWERALKGYRRKAVIIEKDIA